MTYGWKRLLIVALVLGAVACAGKPAARPPGSAEADKFLF